MVEVQSEKPASSASGPLKDIRVLELGQLIAGPYCGQLLADMGADVIKVEPPGTGDPMRQWGREGYPLWWSVLARGKRCITVNLRSAEGQDIIRRLVREIDILVENFRPGTMEKWGLGYTDLSEINSGLIMVRVSGFGQTGPYAARAGYASVGEAMGGLRYVMGEPDRKPSRAGISIGDTLAAMNASFGALAALHHRNQTGHGQLVDASIFESVLAVMEGLIPEYTIEKYTRGRSGSFLPNIAPSNIYEASDGMVVIAANQDTVFARLCRAMEQPDLVTHPDYKTHVMRGANQSRLDSVIQAWVTRYSVAELEAILVEHGVPVSRVYTAKDMMEDQHFRSRKALVELPSEKWGTVHMQNVTPKLSKTPGHIRWSGAPHPGAHNTEVLEGLLQLDASQRQILADKGVI